MACRQRWPGRSFLALACDRHKPEAASRGLRVVATVILRGGRFRIHTESRVYVCFLAYLAWCKPWCVAWCVARCARAYRLGTAVPWRRRCRGASVRGRASAISGNPGVQLANCIQNGPAHFEVIGTGAVDTQLFECPWGTGSDIARRRACGHIPVEVHVRSCLAPFKCGVAAKGS